jgi:hypothetical protein
MAMPCAGELNEQGVDPTTPEEIARAISLRIDYGLRADEPFVREMACAADAHLEFGVPLTEAETEELFSRNTRTEPVVVAVQSYAAQHANEFGGLYIDNSLGGVVTALWTDNVGQHEQAIRSRLDPGTPLVVRQVRWSESDLRRLQRRIGADTDWMADIPARVQGIGVDVISNVTTVDVSSAEPAAVRIILDHYGVAEGMLRVTSDGTGVELLPTGTVRGRVLDPAGRVLDPELSGLLSVDGEAVGVGYCGGGDIGYGLGPDGTYEIPCKVGVYRMVALTCCPKVLGRSVRVPVRANEVVEVDIILDTLPSP